MKNVKKLGVTGGIGSGKSFVAGIFAECGIPCYDCDSAAKRIMLSNAELQHSLQNLIGAQIVHNGTLDKSLIASFLFAGKDNASLINSTVHPFVIEDFNEWCKQKNAELVVLESAILYESGLENTVDYVAVVHAPSQVCLERAMKRDHATAQQIETRMNAQMSSEIKVSKADFIIENGSDASKQDICEQVNKIIKSILLC